MLLLGNMTVLLGDTAHHMTTKLITSIPLHTTSHYITLHYTTLHHTTLHHTTLHYTTLHYTTLHHTTPHYTTLHYTTLHHTTLHYTTLHHTTPHYTTPHHTTLHYTTPHHTTPHYTHCTSPTYFCTSSDPMTRMKQASVRLATALAHSVLPVPGGPKRRTPFGGSMPSFT